MSEREGENGEPEDEGDGEKERERLKAERLNHTLLFYYFSLPALRESWLRRLIIKR